MTSSSPSSSISTTENRSRTPSPTMSSGKKTVYSRPLYILDLITLCIEVSLILTTPIAALAFFKHKADRAVAIKATFINSILFHIIIIIKKVLYFIDSKNSNNNNMKNSNNNYSNMKNLCFIKSLWFDASIHYLIKDSLLFFSGLTPIPLFVGIGSRALFIIAQALDNVASQSVGCLWADCALSFTRPILKSTYLHRFGSILETILLPYLFLATVYFHQMKYLMISLMNFFFFTLMVYQTDPHHRWVWQSLGYYLKKLGWRNYDSFGKIIVKSVEECEKIGIIAEFLYPAKYCPEFKRKPY